MPETPSFLAAIALTALLLAASVAPSAAARELRQTVQYHPYVLEKVKRGIERAESEGAISHEDAKARLGKWLAA